MREVAAAQELVVDASLVEELERRGVHLHAGDRVRLELVSSTDAPDTSRDELWDAFIGSGGDSGDPDLSVKAKEIVRAEMGA
jgi:hypothetical protein